MKIMGEFRKLRIGALIACAGLLIFVPALGAAAKALKIYFVDVEGGQATLIVDGQGESLLVDTGNSGERDPGRIAAAAKSAGIDHLDYVLITHYHGDHVGGLFTLVKQLKINAFIDHGANVETTGDTAGNYAQYQALAAQGKRITVQPGDTIPLKDMRVEVLTAAGQAITSPLPGAGQPNPACASEPKAEPDPSENAQSVGILVTYGKFRFLDLGDLTKAKELALACPNNMIGHIDLLLATHHGFDFSNANALVAELRARAAVIGNSAHKGDTPAAWQHIHDAEGMQDIWQLHQGLPGAAFGGRSGTVEPHNAPDDFIANLGEADQGNGIKVAAETSGSFTVTNQRNNFEKRYKK